MTVTTDERRKPLRTGFFGQPGGLSTLFFTEFWERFSYYGMRAVLLYYMYYQVSDGGLGIDQGTASSVMSIYGSLVFMTGIVGGWFADRLLGSRRSLFTGGVLIMCGHILLSVPGGGVPALFGSMVLIVLGTGMLKPNISKVVGDLYVTDDERRDVGFSIFYISTNFGALIAPVVVNFLRGEGGFHLGFSAAAVGMAAGLVWYVIGGRPLGDAGKAPANPLTPEERATVFGRIGVGLLVVALAAVVLAVTGNLSVDLVIDVVSVLGVVLPICYFTVLLRSSKTTPVERSRVRAYIWLFVASVFFWMIQEQGSVVLAIFADQRTDLDAWGVHLGPELFQSANPLFIVIFAPVFAWLWTKLGHRQPGTPRKVAAGVVLAGLSYVLMMGPGLLNGTETLADPAWLVASFCVVVLGELCLSPVMLSATTRLAPGAFAAQMMSLWFLADAAAQGISAQIVPWFSPATEVAYFGVVGGGTVLLGVLLFVGAPLVQRGMAGVR